MNLIGIDIGGTKCAVVAGTLGGHIRHKIQFSTDTSRGSHHALQRLLEATDETLKHVSSDEAPTFGISCGGPLSSARGVILSPPNLPGWDEVPIVKLVVERFGGRAWLMNDANAGALAQWKWGAARGFSDVVFLTFGTGLGAGLILNKRLHAGRDDAVGELGHWRLAPDGPTGFGKAGSFEGFCSGGGLTRMAQSEVRASWTRGETVTWCVDESAWQALNVQILARAARSGDETARAIFQASGAWLGRGLAFVVDFLNPEIIVLGSVFARCEDLLRPAMQRPLETEALAASVRRCAVVPAARGESLGDYAALAVAHAGLAGEFGYE